MIFKPGQPVEVTNWNGAKCRGSILADPSDGAPNVFVDFRPDDYPTDEPGYPVHRGRVEALPE